MDFSMKSLVAIAGLSLVTGGAIATAYLALPTRATPLLQPDRPGWQRPLTQGYRHPGAMMPMMQINSEFEFFTLMIPHHQEAIDTAQRVLEASDRPELRRFAETIITVQTAEIKQMQTWLGEWFGVTPMPCPM